MKGADGATAPDRPKRGRGRPPNKLRHLENGEPPAKKRKYNRSTPDLGRKETPGRVEYGTPQDFKSDVDQEGFNTALKSERERDDSAENPYQPEENPVSPRTIRARTESRPRRSTARTRSRGRANAPPRPRYSSAAAAAAATQASDGYKPREERSWEEFHPDLDIEVDLMAYTADEVDGRTKAEPKLSGLRQETTDMQAVEDEGAGLGILGANEDITAQPDIPEPPTVQPPPKRRPGRPPRRPESMLSGLGSPPAPRILPIPTHNPKERLNLPKPSYRHVHTFKSYEEDKKVQIEDYVDKAMANVGYQESERFEVPPDILIRHAESSHDDELGAGLVLETDNKQAENAAPPQVGDVEYDMDEQDERWLEMHNAHRKTEQTEPIKPSMFEIAMTQIEREFYALEKRIPKPNPRHANPTRPRSSSAAAVNGEPWGAGDEPDSKCAICDDGDCENANAIIFCDGCDLAVHQECYGVPFIPEGQWFCRKCKEIGRGTPTCIFCPNVEGAFKQTSTLRWAHLLCAIWIPEVSIANPTYMEPIQDVEKVPRSRWGLHCYICDQRMGACIQCSNKACYQAFHVTCARRARLFLKMKASPTSGIDTSILKAFCDKHVSPEWRRDHDTDVAIHNAKRYYRKTMRNRMWADSQTAALALTTNEQSVIEPTIEADPVDEKGSITAAGNKRRKKEPVKTGWRLPSGAPVVPTVVFTAVEQSLARFMLRKRKDFVAEACKYWTLKREARRGAALLKRLQLQLETSSAMEVTRRNFIGMGAAGRPRLVRRIEFAEHLQTDIVKLGSITEAVSQREQKKLEDVDVLRQLMDTVYFPITSLLWPILRKAQKLGEKSQIFEEGLSLLEGRLTDHVYTSVAAFSADIGSLFASILAKSLPDAAGEIAPQDISQIHDSIVPLSWSERQALSADQKLQKQVAKRIVRAIKEPLEAALRKEGELKGVPFQKEMSEWDKLDARLEASLNTEPVIEDVPLQNGVTPEDDSPTKGRNNSATSVSAAGGASPLQSASVADEPIDSNPRSHKASISDLKNGPVQAPSPPISADSNTSHPISTSESSQKAINAAAPIDDPLTNGGIPWYMRPFSPIGTTIHSERYNRAMSEDLSEIDEATLDEMDIDLPSSHTANALPSKARPSPKKFRGGAASAPKNRSRRGQANGDQTQAGRNTRSGSVSVASVASTTRASRSKTNGVASATPASTRKASLQVAAGAMDSPDVLAGAKTNGVASGRRRSGRGKDSGDADDDEMNGDAAEEERLKAEKRDRYNAGRRAARRRGF